MHDPPDSSDLETLSEDSRGGRWERRIDLRTEHGSEARVTLRNDSPGEVLRVTAELPDE